jgi:hypothetical protein
MPAGGLVVYVLKNSKLRVGLMGRHFPGSRGLPAQQSLPPPLFVSSISLKNIFLLAHLSYALQCRAAISPSHSAFAAVAISLPPHALILRCSLLPPARRTPHPRLSLLAPVVPPTWLGVPPASTGAGGAVACFRSIPTEPRAPTKRGPCRWCSRAATRRRLPLRGRNQLALTSPFPYVTNVSFKCFRCYQRYIAKVSYG